MLNNHSDGQTFPGKVRRRIFLVDDHELLRMGLAQLISTRQEWEVCGQAAEGPTALEQIRHLLPDLAIVDLRLQSGDGLELVRQIRSSASSVRVLVFSQHEEDLYAERCLKAGAHGYVSKQSPVPTVISAIECVADGKVFLSSRMTDRVLARQAGSRDEKRSHLESLSDRELEVFERLGRGKSVKEIANELHLSAKTVEYHRQHIKEKLRIPTSTAVVRLATAYSLGVAPSAFYGPDSGA